MQIAENLNQKNLAFWETAWSRVKTPSTNIPESMAYLLEAPEIFKTNKCKNILDIACGSGWLSFLLAENGFDVTGIDISKSAIKLAKSVQEQRQENKIDFIELDMFAMKFGKNQFDGILVNACLEHLDLARGEQFIANIKEILKPEAVMFGVFDKVGTSDKGEYEVLDDGTQQYKDEFRNGMFLRNYSDEELKQLFAKHSWQIESLKYNSYGSRIIVAKNQKAI